MLHLRLFVLSLSFLVLCSEGVTFADDADEARAVAMNILKQLEQKKTMDVWSNYVSNWFKRKTTEKAFLANMTVIHAQLGGTGTDRDLIQQGKADGDSQSGYQGTVYSFLFGTTFPMAKVYETIVLIIEDNTYRLAGINYVPNPNP